MVRIKNYKNTFMFFQIICMMHVRLPLSSVGSSKWDSSQPVGEVLMDIEDVNGYWVMWLGSDFAFGCLSSVANLSFSELRDEQIFTSDGSDAPSLTIMIDIISR